MSKWFGRVMIILLAAVLFFSCSNLMAQVLAAFLPGFQSGTGSLVLYAGAGLLTLGAFALLLAIPYPHYRGNRTLNLPPEELTAVVKTALKELGWPLKSQQSTEIQAEVPTTGWSWHHDFSVKFLPGGVIQAESKSAYREVFFDFGRNRRNVEKFFAQVVQSGGHPV